MKKTTVKIKEISKSPNLRLDAKYWIEKENETIKKLMKEYSIVKVSNRSVVPILNEYYYGNSKNKRIIAEISKTTDELYQAELFFPVDVMIYRIDNFDTEYQAEKFILEQWSDFLNFFSNVS